MTSVAPTIRAEAGSLPQRRLDAERVRADFPILQDTVNGRRLVYLDNAATTQKPQAVIDAVSGYYLHDNANVHRAVYHLAERATAAYEAARVKVRRFINASCVEQIIFTRGTTEAINLVASSWGRPNLKPGDQVLVTGMEHHSNIVPWQLICEQTGAQLVAAPINDRGELILEPFERLLGPRVRFVAAVHVSNALGTVNPVRRIIELAHARGVPVLIDGAQAAPHMAVDVTALDCDFYAFSGHKLYGPTGIGVLYGKTDLLEALPPYQGGGDMIRSVTFEKTTYAALPYRFEAGTPDIAGTVGLGAAIDYLTALGCDAVTRHERELLEYATAALLTVPDLRLIGTAREKAGVISFVLDGIHPHDVGTLLDREGVAVRTGHHCAQPVMERFGVPATTRVSLAAYNTTEDIDALVAGLRKVRQVFA